MSSEIKVSMLRIDDRSSNGRVEIKIFRPSKEPGQERGVKIGVINVPPDEAAAWIEFLQQPQTRIVRLVEVEEDYGDGTSVEIHSLASRVINENLPLSQVDPSVRSKVEQEVVYRIQKLQRGLE